MEISDLKNWKCKECGHVCGTEQGIRSHYEYEKKKKKGHNGMPMMEETSEPRANFGGWNKRKKNKKRKKVDIFKQQRKPQPMTTSSDDPLVIYPLVIRGNEVVHPGSFGVFAEPQEINEKSLLETLIHDERV